MGDVHYTHLHTRNTPSLEVFQPVGPTSFAGVKEGRADRKQVLRPLFPYVSSSPHRDGVWGVIKTRSQVREGLLGTENLFSLLCGFLVR